MSCQVHYMCGTDCKGLEKLEKQLADSQDFTRTLVEQYEKLETSFLALVKEKELLLKNKRKASKTISESKNPYSKKIK